MSFVPNYAQEEALVSAAILVGSSTSTTGFADWDGMIEIGRCVDTFNGVERIDEDDDDQHWVGAPFWSVYLHQDAGGVDCVADFRTELEANAFAAGLYVYRTHLLALKG